MTKITINGWKVGFNKVQFNIFIRERCGYGLAEAKRIVDTIVRNEEVELLFPEFSQDDQLRLSDLGAEYEINF